MKIKECWIEHRVEFAETDAAGFLHFSNYFRLMEKAERVLFQEAGLTLFENLATEMRGWPRVQAQAEFRHPLQYNERVWVHLEIKEISRHVIKYRFSFHREEKNGLSVASGEMTTLAARFDRATGLLSNIEIPDAVTARFSAAQFTQS